MGNDRKVAIVTGSARGIGKSIAANLADKGISVVITDVMIDQAEETAKELAKKGVETLAIKADVSNVSEVKDLYKKVVGEFGTVDYLINNAGILAII